MDDKYIGKTLGGRYEVMELIGVGGMAYVYKARCHRLNRFVALKILKDDYARDEDFRRRFHDESHAVAMLSHPNIVMVHDLSRSEDVEYIVMELVDGITLKQYMQRKGNLTWREALHFVIQIVKALSHAHSRGIIHRDIKPHNVMLLRDGSVKVADFGIARFASKQQNTLTQEALGSVHYISPEQARGSRIDARSDIYSAGVVLYEMLTGRLPFEGDTAVSVVLQHIQSMPLSPGELNPDIPQALEMITVKAMAPDLEERYASAADMLADLEEFRKNPSIRLDYQLSANSGKESVPGRENAGAGKGMSIEPKEEAAERRRIRRQIIQEENHKIRGRSNLIATLSAVLGVLVLISFLGYYIYTKVTDRIKPNTTEMVDVPGLIGGMYEEGILAEYQDFEITVEMQHNDSISEGRIFNQEPKQGARVPQGSALTLYVSMGKAQFSLVSLIGMSETNAEKELARLGLKTVKMQDNTNLAPRGDVFDTEPKAGALVQAGDQVTIYISLGVDIKQVPVPSLIGMDTQEAANTLQMYNLRLGSITEVEGNEAAGTIVWQSVNAGENADENTQIDVNISLGSQVEETEPPAVVTEPPVVVTEPPVTQTEPPVVVTEPPVVVTEPPVAVTEKPAAATFDKKIGIPEGITGLTLLEVFVNDDKQISQTISADDMQVQVTLTAAVGDTLTVKFDGVTHYVETYNG